MASLSYLIIISVSGLLGDRAGSKVVPRMLDQRDGWSRLERLSVSSLRHGAMAAHSHSAPDCLPEYLCGHVTMTTAVQDEGCGIEGTYYVVQPLHARRSSSPKTSSLVLV